MLAHALWNSRVSVDLFACEVHALFVVCLPVKVMQLGILNSNFVLGSIRKMHDMLGVSEGGLP